MSNQQLFEQVENLLRRKLTPEECKFLALANEVLQQKKDPPRNSRKEKENAKIVA
ncbi:MAG: hypothetical protein WA655_05030 [Candidatus Korobacteraceae bacterium]